MRRAANLILGLLMLAGLFIPPVSAAPQKDELKKLSDQIAVLESVLNQNISQSFGGPFGIIDKARGAYLPGFGVVLDFDLNLSSNPALGPFASVPSSQELHARRAEEERRRKDATALAQRTLTEFGQTLTALGPGESVAIVIHAFTLGDQGLRHSVIVVQASKKSIDEYHANAIDRAAFLHKLAVLEY